MGLAGPRKRTKISNDPNNTKWSRDTNSFGHKILAAQGWQPGQYLGAKDANHAEHYTAASASHVRALLKDDNLGLGAKRGGENAETFGLSMFSGLLGRLNGKSDESLEKEQKAQRDVKLALYQGRKFGQVMFVSAGFLVGDKIEVPASKGLVGSNGTKRKRTDRAENTPLNEEQITEPTADATTDMQKKKQKVGRAESEADASSTDAKGESHTNSNIESKEQRRERRRKEKADRRERKERAADSSATLDSDSGNKAQRKAERKARKEERRRRKEERRARRATKATSTPESSSDSDTEAVVQAVNPAVARFIGRQAVRQRYIQQKRLASVNPQALKEVCLYAQIARKWSANMILDFHDEDDCVDFGVWNSLKDCLVNGFGGVR